jgi:hypothetical protein
VTLQTQLGELLWLPPDSEAGSEFAAGTGSPAGTGRVAEAVELLDPARVR